ncbi:type II toxin-antitoxin system antitoxin DNA ADP-ribosyl glycohydrolase DarG, partial [Roseateles sp. GG27B]
LDGSYLHCDKRISDAAPFDVIWFDDERRSLLQAYLKAEAKPYAEAMAHTAAMIDGFESPFGMELLATVDWLISREKIEPTVGAVREGIRHWRGGTGAAQRKDRLFD